MSRKRLVLPLGHEDLGTNLPERRTAVAKTASIIADPVEEGWQVVMTHSNTPQVGIIHGVPPEFAMHREGYTPSPLSVCSAMSQGYVGHDLQNGLRSGLLSHDIYKCASTIMTKVTADPRDEAFYQSLKITGRFMTKGEAETEDIKGNHTVEIPSKSYQCIAPAPNPVAIVEIGTIRAFSDADQVVTCCGGGGMPVLEQGTAFRDASTIIEKNLTPGLLARGVDMGVLLILAAIDSVTLNFDTLVGEAISEMSIDDAKTYMEAGRSEFKSMFPKAKAAINSASVDKSRAAIIMSLVETGQTPRGRAGMRIS